MNWGDERRAVRIAELDTILALHQPDASGHCARCVSIGLEYAGSDKTWPCGPHELAAEERARLLAPPLPRQRHPDGDAAKRPGR